MSATALQADALHKTLSDGLNDLALRFFAKASTVIDNPWNIAVGADLKMPETVGPRTTLGNFINWYLSNVHKCAHSDPSVAVAFCHVAQLLAAPSSLMRPRILLPVLADAVIRKLKRAGKAERPRLSEVKARRRLPSDGF
jgi:hypothetical protein